MGTAAPVIVAEMADWVVLGGGNSGIVGNSDHTYGFHVAADELPASDYSRTRDPNGSDGPYVDWDYACAGDFSHRGDEKLRALHRNVLARLMRGELPMICEFIGQPWADQPVYYWARWNGERTLLRYTGSGHDTWSHISWYRSTVDRLAYLWTTAPTQEDDMFVIKALGGPLQGKAYLCEGRDPTTGLLLLTLCSPSQVQDYRAAGIRYAEVNNINLTYYTVRTPPLTATVAVELTDEQLAEVEAAAREGAEAGSASPEEIADAVADEQAERLKD